MRYLILTLVIISNCLCALECVTTEKLKKLMASEKDLVLADARARKYYTGFVIPGAVYVYHRMSDKEITQRIPSKDSLVIAYCSNSHCPVSHWLCERLIQMGYNRVFCYSKGIDGWMDAGNGVSRAKKTRKR